MSDNCHFSISILDKDKAEINKIMFGEEKVQWSEEEFSSDKTDEIRLTEYHANYGYYDQREKLAMAGMSFYGYCGPGGNYGECVFACYGGHHVEASSTENIPVAVVDKDGSVSSSSLAKARDYYRTLNLVEKYFEADADS